MEVTVRKQDNVASVWYFQISEVIQFWNEDDHLTQMMKDSVELLLVPKASGLSNFFYEFVNYTSFCLNAILCPQYQTVS